MGVAPQVFVGTLATTLATPPVIEPPAANVMHHRLESGGEETRTDQIAARHLCQLIRVQNKFVNSPVSFPPDVVCGAAELSSGRRTEETELW